MRVIVLGCGRTGAYLATQLVGSGHQVTVVDKDGTSFGRLGPDFAGALVVGTGIDEDVLCRAGIEQAEALIAVTDSENTNIMAAQVARDILHVPRAVCRIYDPMLDEIYRDLKLDTVCPTLWAAAQIQELLNK